MESLHENNNYPVVPRSNHAGYRSEKKPPSNRGPELERTVLSMSTIIALSSLAERFFENHQTLFYEIYGTEQCKNRDCHIYHFHKCMQQRQWIAPFSTHSTSDVKAPQINQQYG